MKIAIVTGASSGMGRQFVLQLNQYVNVDEIWVIARRELALNSLKEEVSVPLRTICLDLTQESSFDTIAQLLGTEKPDVKLLVNAAGFGKFGSFEQISIEDGVISVQCSPVEHIVFYSNVASSRERCQSGHGITNAVYHALDLPGRTDRYIRIQLIDSEGRSAWSNPIIL